MIEKIKQYFSYVLCMVIPTLFSVIFIFFLDGYSFIGYVLIGVALVSAFYLILRLIGGRYAKVSKTLNKIVTYCILIFLFAAGVTITVIAGDANTDNNDGAEYAIVFGAGVNGKTPSSSLSARIDAAIKYADENPGTIFILSGGKGDGESISEAECIFREMTSSGISADRLILEESSQNTLENAQFSAAIIKSIDPEFDGKVCVITEIYHVTRAKLCTEDAGFSIVVSETGYNGRPILTANYYIREVFALWKYMLFDRT